MGISMPACNTFRNVRSQNQNVLQRHQFNANHITPNVTTRNHAVIAGLNDSLFCREQVLAQFNKESTSSYVKASCKYDVPLDGCRRRLHLLEERCVAHHSCCVPELPIDQASCLDKFLVFTTTVHTICEVMCCYDTA